MDSGTRYFVTVRGISQCHLRHNPSDTGTPLQENPDHGSLTEAEKELPQVGAHFIESSSSGVTVDHTPPWFRRPPHVEATSADVDTFAYDPIQSGIPSPPQLLEFDTDASPTIDVIVTAEDQQTQETYSIEVEFLDDVQESRLVNLTVVRPSSLSTFALADFTPSTTKYALNVDFAVDHVSFMATPMSEHARVKIGLAGLVKMNLGFEEESAFIPLGVGINTVEVRVTAEDGETDTLYTVTVTRETASISTDINSIDVLDPDTGSILATVTAPVSTSSSVVVAFAQTNVLLRVFLADKGATAKAGPKGGPYDAVVSGVASPKISLVARLTSTLEVVVIAEDRVTEVTFELEVSREAADGNTGLAELKFTEPYKDSEVRTFPSSPIAVDVDNKGQTAVVLAETRDPRSSVRLELNADAHAAGVFAVTDAAQQQPCSITLAVLSGMCRSLPSLQMSIFLSS
jgi:hypothetical protein